MDPSAIHNLLFNLKLQLLALPALAKWGLLAFVSIKIGQEVITVGWDAYTRRRLQRADIRALGAPVSQIETRGDVTEASRGPAALPAPDAFGNPFTQSPDASPVRIPTPPQSTAV
ncbi:MAG: hypothetical protein ABJD11_10075 [Gemmatimonadota bacterium]